MLTASNCFSPLSRRGRNCCEGFEIMVSLYEIGRNAYVLSRCVGGAVKTLTIVEVLAGFLRVVIIKLIVNLIKFLLVFFLFLFLFQSFKFVGNERNEHCRFI